LPGQRLGRREGGALRIDIIVCKSRPEGVRHAQPSCGPIVPVLDSTATYDPATQTIRLPIALANTWAREVETPARACAWNDSITITSPGGLVNDTSGNHLRLSNADSTIGATASRLVGARLRRFDKLLAPRARPAGARGRRHAGPATWGLRWIEIHVVSGSPTAFTVVPHAAAENAHPISMAAPEGEPAGMYDDTNLIADVAGLGPGKVVKNIIDMVFVATATQAERQAAVDSINGVAVGGVQVAHNGDGFYLIRIPADSATAIGAALQKLRALPQVQLAVPIRLGIRPDRLKPHDGAGW
jgi:hypothetical protein